MGQEAGAHGTHDSLASALVGAGLASRDQLPPPSLPRHQTEYDFSLSPQLGEKATQVRLYLDVVPEPDWVERTKDTLRELGFKVGSGEDVDMVRAVIPGPPDDRLWIQIECRSSLVAGYVLEAIRANPPQDVPCKRITTPGIRA